MGRQMCYVTGQVISGCVQKWKKIIVNALHYFYSFHLACHLLQIMLLFLELTVLLCCTARGSPGRFGDICACLLLSLGNHLYNDCVLISSPPPSTPPIFFLWKKASKNEHLAKKLSWFKEEVPWIYELPFLLKYKLEREFAAQLFRGQGAGVGWVGALGLLLRPEKHFASAEWLLACQDAVVFYPDSVLGKDSGCELKALVLLIIHQS